MTRVPNNVATPDDQPKPDRQTAAFTGRVRRNQKRLTSDLNASYDLRVIDGSIMPRVTTGNTMAPCIVMGERTGEIPKACHGL